MGKKKKKKKAEAVEDDDDSIDLSSLISALKEDSSTTKKVEPQESTEEEPEEVFVLVDDEKKDEPKVDVDAEARKAKEAIQEERRKMEDERKVFEEERRRFEEMKDNTETELKTFGADLVRKKEQISKLEEQLRNKESEQREKEKNIKKATDLLISQRNNIGEKEKRLETLKAELQQKAQELKEKEVRLATFKDRTKELDGRQMQIKELEDKLKERELHLRTMEDQLSECPRCSSRDRFVNVERMIDELKEFGIIDDQATNDLTQMRRLIDEGQNDRAIEMGDQVIKRLKELKSEVLVKGIRYLLLGAEKALRHAKEISGHTNRVEDIERWLQEARGLMEKEEYKTAEYYIKEADFLLQSVAKGVDVTPVAPPTEQPVQEMKSYNCPSCFTTFTVDTHERPVRITCPGCQIELLIKEDVTYA